MTTETGGLDLEAVQARADAATEGPWEVERYEDDDGHRARYVRFGPLKDSTIIDHDEDAEFIAAARTDVPALLAEVEQLRGLHADGCVQTVESLRTLIRAVLDVCDRLAANAATNPSQVVAVATMVIVREIRAALGVSA